MGSTVAEWLGASVTGSTLSLLQHLKIICAFQQMHCQVNWDLMLGEFAVQDTSTELCGACNYVLCVKYLGLQAVWDLYGSAAVWSILS